LQIDVEEKFKQGEREAEDMIVEAYAALLLAFLSRESDRARFAIAQHLPGDDLTALVPVLERFVVSYMF
jgi:DNA-binding FadR family transcriptional regulator